MRSLADQIIYGQTPDYQAHVSQGESLDDIDEYGFTPLIECAIVGRVNIAKELMHLGVDIDKPDVTGRTALHWAVDNNNEPLVKLLLASGANPNAYNRGGQPVLVFPLLRDQWMLKQVLYQAGASLDFALDFINAKLIGHRYELKGDVDILSGSGEYIELDYEGFFLEFSLASIQDSLSRFRNNFSARNLREYFAEICEIIDGYQTAEQLLKLQHQRLEALELEKKIAFFQQQHVLVLPVAYRGHAIAFVRCGEYFAKIDRGENSLTEGTVNLYKMGNPAAFSAGFIRELLFTRQSEAFVHHEINRVLALQAILKLPVSAQITGNCSFANIEAVVPTAFVLQHIAETGSKTDLKDVGRVAFSFYQQWLTWDKDRALDECLMSFPEASTPRQASKAATLGAVLFQACDYGIKPHMVRAEKILKILMLPEFHYVLQSYLSVFCVKKLTMRGNNLLKILEDAGIDSKTGVFPVATQVGRDGLPS
jgi:hypothetical protein